MRRWLIRIAIGFAALLVLVVIIIQSVLWSNLPKNIVTSQIEKQLGLRIAAQSLHTGWLGHTELDDVSIGLPLESTAFLSVKSLKIHHNSLFGLAVGNSFSVESIEIDKPDIVIVQDAQGNWNLQQVAVLLARTLGSNSVQQTTTDTSIPGLPIISLVDGNIWVQNIKKQTTRISPLNVTGRPFGALVWKYNLSLADSVRLNGVLAPGGTWQHQLTLDVHNLDPLLQHWTTTYGAQMHGTWSGQFTNGKIVGNLALQDMSAKQLPAVGDVSLTGAVDVQSADGVLTMHPNRIELNTSLGSVSNVIFRSGDIACDSAGVHVQALKVNLLGGLANVDAQFDSKTKDSSVAAVWSGLSLTKKTNQNGSLIASLHQPFSNQPVVNLDLHSDGTVGDTASVPTNAPPNNWDAHLHVRGRGTSWQSIDWILTAPQLMYTAGTQTYNLANLTAHVSQRVPEGQPSPVIELTDLSLPPDASGHAQLSAAAKIDFNSRKWNVTASDILRTTIEGSPANIDFALSAAGTDTRYDLKNLSLTCVDTTIAFAGSYDAARPFDKTNPGPLALHVTLSQAARLEPDSPISGTVSGELNIVGDLFRKDADDTKPKDDKDPWFHFRPYLDVNGQLRGSDLIVFNQNIGSFDIKLDGATATALGELPQTLVKTTQFQFLKAPWTFSLMYPNPNNALEVNLQVSQLSLQELTKVWNGSNISGDVTSAKWQVIATAADPNAIDLHSEYHVSQLAVAGINTDTLDATATLHKGVLELNPLIARSDSGSITSIATIDLNNPQRLTSKTTVDSWPIQLSAVTQARISAQANMVVDLQTSQVGASGTITASADVLRYANQQTSTIAHADLTADLRSRLIDLTSLTGNLQKGTFTGEAKIDFDKPLLATGFVQWNRIDGTALADVLPVLDGLGGKFSGTINIAPAKKKQRPLEPVRMDLSMVADHGHFRSIKIGGPGVPPMRAIAYVNVDRAVLDQSDLYFAGGAVHVWCRISNKGGLSDQTLIDFDHLDLDQIAHVDTALTESMPGILDGHLGFIRSGKGANQLLATGHVDLAQTDLAHVGPVAALYDLMSVGRAGSKPTGYGSVDVAFEQNTFRVTGFRFFNRGVDARGLLTVGPLNYKKLGATPIGGQVAGAARPLKDIRLPLLDDFDQMFSVLQTNLTTVNIVGTLDKRRYPQATIADIGSALRQLIVGDAEAGQQNGQ